MPPSHTLQLPRASSPTSLRTQPPTPSWLLSLIIKRRPTKARAWHISLIFNVSSVGAPNRQTSHRAAKPGHRHLAWDHREPRCHWLRALVFSPWRERAKLVEGRVAAAHFGCCVLCCVLWLWQARFCYLTGRKSWDWASQNGQFFRIHNKKCITRCPQCKRMSKIVIVLRFWTCLDIRAETWYWSIMSAEKVCYFLPRLST